MARICNILLLVLLCLPAVAMERRVTIQSEELPNNNEDKKKAWLLKIKKSKSEISYKKDPFIISSKEKYEEPKEKYEEPFYEEETTDSGAEILIGDLEGVQNINDPPKSLSTYKSDSSLPQIFSLSENEIPSIDTDGQENIATKKTKDIKRKKNPQPPRRKLKKRINKKEMSPKIEKNSPGKGDRENTLNINDLSMSSPSSKGNEKRRSPFLGRASNKEATTSNKELPKNASNVLTKSSRKNLPTIYAAGDISNVDNLSNSSLPNKPSRRKSQQSSLKKTISGLNFNLLKNIPPSNIPSNRGADSAGETAVVENENISHSSRKYFSNLSSRKNSKNLNRGKSNLDSSRVEDLLHANNDSDEDNEITGKPVAPDAPRPNMKYALKGLEIPPALLFKELYPSLNPPSPVVPFGRRSSQPTVQPSRMDGELRLYLLTGNIQKFEERINELDTMGTTIKTERERLYAYYARSAGYQLWAESLKNSSCSRGERNFIEGINDFFTEPLFVEIEDQNKAINFFKQDLFFGVEWGDFALVWSAINGLNALKISAKEIINVENKTPQQIAENNGYLLLVEHCLKNGSIEEGDEHWILEQILEINQSRLSNPENHNKANLLSWSLIENLKNLSEIEKEQFKGTILRWLEENKFTFEIKNGKNTMAIDIDESSWPFFKRRLLLEDKNIYENRKPRVPCISPESLSEISKIIQQGKFMEKADHFLIVKRLIDEGMDLEKEFVSPKGSRTLAALAASKGQRALALAFHNKILWDLFDKERYFIYLKYIAHK